MTLTVRQRPYAVATVFYCREDVDAVRALIEAIAPDQCVAFLLVEDDAWLDEERNALRDRIKGTSSLRVGTGDTGGAMEPNSVYFVRRRSVRAVMDGELRLTSGSPSSSDPADLEPFFSSLADDQGRRGCVLVFARARSSRSGDEPGVALVAEAGGLVLIQDQPDGAFRRITRASEQPQPIVSLVTLEQLPHVLLEQAEPLIAEVSPRSTSALYRDVEAILPALCDVLLDATGHDFGQYKSSTLIRRTLRRLHMIRCTSTAAYLEKLRVDRAEAVHLFNDLLINVTAFFRDPAAFDQLNKQAVPRIFASRAAGEAVRVWVAGCATGEEAYSLAMIFREYAEVHDPERVVQIFATDIDEPALDTARRGMYPAARLAHVSPERTARFFTRSGGTYKVKKELRDLVLFSRHSITSDAPFSHVDLVSCRNLLIYLSDELHHLVIPLFHYALRPNGFLFLGPSESLSGHQDLFQPVDARYRISERVNGARRSPPRLHSGGQQGLRRPASSGVSADADTVRTMQQMLTDAFTPTGVVVTDEGLIVATSGNVEEFMSVAPGTFVNSITRMARGGLRVAVRAALRDAVALRQRVVHHGASVRSDEGVQRVTVTVLPFAGQTDTGLFLVVFQLVGRPIAPSTSPTHHNEAANALIDRLELDLASTRDELHRTVQDLEAVNEELKSSNEELLSMNEELQSTNEELEASKDELQGANSALEASNSDLANLLASTRIPTIFLDDAGNVRRVTPDAGAVYNLRVGDTGRPLVHFTHKAMHMPALPPAAAVHTSTRPIEDEVEMEDGTWYLRRVLPYVTAAGVHEGIVITFTDVSERRGFEGELSASESRFRQLADAIPQLAWMAHPNGDIFWYNQRWYDYTGSSEKEMEGWGWTRAHDPDVLPSVLERWRASIAAGTSFDMVFPLLGADGAFRPFLTRICPFRNDRGEIVRWFGTNTDVSEERAQREVLRRRQRELQTLTDNSPDIMIRFNRQYQHVFANAAVEGVTGLSPAAFIGRTNRELGMPDELCTLWETMIERVFETGEQQTVEFDFLTPRGTRFFVGRLVAELDDQGDVQYVLGVTRDRTGERAAETALHEANRRKDEFLATLAHELRNPLAPVRNGLEILRLSANGDALTASVREIMERQIVTMTRLIDDLLDISRISLGKVELKREPVTLASILAAALEVSRPAIQSAGHVLTVLVPEEPLVLDADGTRLAQVVGNLLHNAAKYTPDGGNISLAAESQDGYAVIRVSDDGIGIPEAMLEGVFDMFTQIAQANVRGQGGLGIGLALVRQLVEMHGGNVRAESAGAGVGSTFTVRLPLSQSPTLPPGPAPHTEGDDRERMHVLVVDDNVDAARSLTTILTLMGHETQTAYSGTGALALVRELSPDVVFLDIGLPDMNGYEVAAAIRSDPAFERIVLVALTGWGSDEHRRRSAAAGIDFHLTKPVDAAVIRRILSRRSVV